MSTPQQLFPHEPRSGKPQSGTLLGSSLPQDELLGTPLAQEVAEMKIRSTAEIRREVRHIVSRQPPDSLTDHKRDRHCGLANASYTSEHAITSGRKQFNNIE